MNDNTSAPLTLAAFEQILDRKVLYDGSGEQADLPELLRPIILRLLAGERERCAELVRARAGAHTEAMRAGEREATAACMFADHTVAAICNMGDPA